VLDDVHWAAKPTLLLLRHLLRAPEALRVLVVATYRDTDLDRTHPLAEMLADLRRAPGVERLALAGLDEQGVIDFLEHTAGHELDDAGMELARVVRDETEGNPFFVGEVLRHLAESGALVFRDGRWTSDLSIDEVGIPEGVREVVGRRLSHLPSETNEVLTVASVVGRDFDMGLLASIAGGEEAVLDALEAAEASGLVASVPGRAASYRFSHALVRSTLYDELTTSRRLRLHRDVARALVERPDAEQRLPELARHFGEAAALGEVDRAIEYCRRAGDAARDELAFEESAAHYERALNALELADEPDPQTRAGLLLGAGEALAASADPRAREVLLRAATVARESHDTVNLVDAALALTGLVVRGGWVDVDAELVALLEEGLRELGDQDADRRALALSALGVALLWDDDAARRRALLEEAADLARRSDNREVLAQVLYRQVHGYDHTDAATVERSKADIVELVGVAEATADPTILLYTHEQQLLRAVMFGDRATADAALLAIENLAIRLRQPAYEAHARILRSAHLLLSGRLDDAEHEITALAAFQAQHQLPPNGPPTLMYRLFYERGRLGEIEPLIADLVESQPAVATWRVALIGVYTNTDQLDLAREQLEIFAAHDFAMVPRNNLWLVTIAGAARTAAIVGMLDVAEWALEAMLPFGDLIAVTGMSYEQPVGMSIGVAAAALGRWAEAEDLFGRALALCERLQAPTFTAATQVAWAQALVERNGPGDVARARELAAPALVTADELGLGRVAELSRRLLD
ncbi:MAG: ATP-binding protein, partial [Acidimicrobiia bacterium]